jgi:multicomponent Na+:H+ antiporter subunit D
MVKAAIMPLHGWLPSAMVAPTPVSALLHAVAVVKVGAFTVAALSFIGVPLFAGFVTKWYLSLGALENGAWWYVAVMLASALLNAAYWLPVIYTAFFKSPPAQQAEVHESHWTLLVPTLICAGYVLLLGATVSVPGMPFSLASAAVTFVFGM